MKTMLIPAVFILPAIFISINAEAGTAGFRSLVERVSAKTGVPSYILEKVCTHESQSFYNGKKQPWPWTLNVKGKGLWFKSKMAAVVYAKLEILSGNNSVDIGLCQINWYWHRSNFQSVEQMINPNNNVYYAAKYLKKLRGEKSWEYAVGAYHSPSNTEAAIKYAQKVLSH